MKAYMFVRIAEWDLHSHHGVPGLIVWSPKLSAMTLNSTAFAAPAS